MAKKTKKKATKKKAAKKVAKKAIKKAAAKTGKKTGKKTAKKTRKKARRTVLYSSKGKKLYAVRDASGQFKDIQSYAKAHAADIKKDEASNPAEQASQN
jgi:DNA-binding protein HU-beta